MPTRPSYFDTETTSLLDETRFGQQLDDAVSGLHFHAALGTAIDGLRRTAQQALAPAPLPIVVSDRPDARVIQQQQQAAAMPTTPTLSVPGSAPEQQPTAGASGVPAAMPTGGGDPTGMSDEQWARSEAARLGIDPQKAVDVGNTEGGFTQPGRQNKDGAPAYSAYQLYITGSGNGTGALGDAALAAGIDPRDPAQSKRAITYALEHAAKNGWGDFQGAAGAGIGDWDGIGQANPSKPMLTHANPAIPAEQTPAAQAQGPTSFERPTQFAEGLPYAQAIAACGLAGVAWFIGKTGRTPKTVAEVRDAAQVSQDWDPGSGMHGAQATAHLLRTQGIAAHVEDGVDWAKVRRDVQTGNPVMFDTDAGSNGHYYTVQAARQRPDGQWEYDLGTSATDLRASGGRRWYSADEVEGLGFGRPARTIYSDNPQTPSPSPAAGRTSSNAPAPDVMSPDQPATSQQGAFSAPAGRSGGGGVMYRQPLQATGGPDTAPDAPYDPRQADEGPHEAYTGGGVSPGGSGTPDAAYATPAQVAQPAPASTYNDPTAGGTLDQPLPPQQPYQSSPDGQVAVPPDWNPPPGPEARYAGTVDTAPAAAGDDPGTQQTMPRPPQVAQQAMVPNLKPIYDLGGRIIGYVQHAAQDVAQGAYDALEPARQAAANLDNGELVQEYPDEPNNLVRRGSPILGAFTSPVPRTTPVRPASYAPSEADAYDADQGRHELPPGMEMPGQHLVRGLGPNGYGPSPQADSAMPGPLPIQLPSVAAESARGALLGSAVDAAHAYREGEQGQTVAAAWDAALAALNLAGLPYTVGQDVLNGIVPHGGDVAMAAMVLHDVAAVAPKIAGGIRSLVSAGVPITRDVYAALRDGTAVDQIIATAGRGLNAAADAVDAGIGAAGRGARALGEDAGRVGAPGEMQLGSGFVPDAPRPTVSPPPEPVRRLMDVYEAQTPARLEEATNRTVAIAVDRIAGKNAPGTERQRVAQLIQGAIDEGERMLGESKVVATGIDGRAAEALIGEGQLTNKFAGGGSIQDVGRATRERVGPSRISQEQGEDFTRRELRADQMLFGEGNFNGRMYAHVTAGPPLVAEAKPAVWLVWDEATPRVTNVHHHYALGSPNADIHAPLATSGTGDAVWGQGAVTGARRIETATGPLNVGWRSRGIDIGDGRRIADTPWAVGPSGEDRMRVLAQVLGIPGSGRDSLGQMIRRGEISDPADLAAVLLRESAAQQQPAVTAARAMGAAEPEAFRLGSATNRTRSESMIVDPRPSNVRAIYLVGNGPGYLNETVERTGGLVKGTKTRLQVAQEVQRRIEADTGQHVPVLFKDTTPERVGAAGVTPGSKLITDAQEILPDGSMRPVSPEQALAPGRRGIVDRYTQAGYQDIGAGFIPSASTLRNAAQGGVVGAASEDIQTQQEDRPPDPTTRLIRGAGGAMLGIGAGRAAGAGRTTGIAPGRSVANVLTDAGREVGALVRGVRGLGSSVAEGAAPLAEGAGGVPARMLGSGLVPQARPTVETAIEALQAARQQTVEAKRAVQQAGTREARQVAEANVMLARQAETDALRQLDQARSSRLGAEPAIRSDVGPRLQDAGRAMTQADAEMLDAARYPRERVHPDMQATIGPVDDAPRDGTISLGSGFVPDTGDAAARFSATPEQVAAEAERGPVRGRQLNRPITVAPTNVPRLVRAETATTNVTAAARWAENMLYDAAGTPRPATGSADRPSSLARRNWASAGEARVEEELAPAVHTAAEAGLQDELPLYLSDVADRERLDEAYRQGHAAASDAQQAQIDRAQGQLDAAQEASKKAGESLQAEQSAGRSGARPALAEQRADDAVRRAQAALDRLQAEAASTAGRAGERALRQAERAVGATRQAIDARIGGTEQRVEAAGQSDALQSAAQAVWDNGRRTLEEARDAGHLSQEDLDHLTQVSPHWVPSVAPSDLLPPGRSGPRHLDEVARAGRGEAVNPIVAARNATIVAERANQENHVAQALMRLYDDAATSSGGLQPADGGERQLWGGTKKLTATFDGKQQSILVPQPIADGLTAVTGMGMNADSAVGVLKYLMGLQSAALTAGRAAFIPKNMRRDLDSYLINTMAREGGPQHLPGIMGAWLSEAGKAAADIFRAQGNARTLASAAVGGVGGASLGDENTTPAERIRHGAEGAAAMTFLGGANRVAPTGKAAELLARGGGTGGIGTSLKVGQRWYRDVLRDGGVPIRTPQDFANFLRDWGHDIVGLQGVKGINERTELISKTAAMRRADAAGESPGAAVLAAKDVTYDPDLGGTMVRQMNNVVQFMNATVQGGAQTYRLWRQHPREALASMTMVMAPAVLAAEAWNRSDPDRAAAYDDVPQYAKDAGIVWMLPWAGSDTRGSRPQYIVDPTELSTPFVVAMRAAAQHLDKIVPGLQPSAGRSDVPTDAGDVAQWGAVLNEALSMFHPLRGDSPGGLVAGMVPPVLREGVGLYLNKDVSSGNEIAPTSSTAPGSSNDRASEVSRRVAGAANTVGRAVNDYTPARPVGDYLEGVQPSQVDYALRKVAPAYGDVATGASDMVKPTPYKQAEQGRAVNEPFVGGAMGAFVKDTPGGSLERAQVGMTTPALQRVLREAKMRPGDVSLDVPADYQNATLTRAEQLRWQRALPGALNEELATVRDSRAWDDPTTRPQAVKAAISKAMDRAAKDVLGLSAADIKDRQERAQQLQRRARAQ